MNLGPEPRDTRWPREIRQRRCAPRWLAIGAAVCLTISGVMPAPSLAAKPVGGGGSCSLVPQLRDVTINQGLGSYPRLARGKETLVRFYLSLPSCAATGSSIALTGGSLTVRNGSTTLGTVTAPTPVLVGPAFPLLAPFGSASALDAPADPKFVVAGSMLAPSSTTASFTASFSGTITYLSKLRSTDAGTPGTITFTTMPDTNTAISKAVEQRTNALRILVVPMGNAGLSFASQFSTSANAAVQEGMLTLSRLFPVPDGTGDLAGTSGGVRYTINPTLLNIAQLLNSSGKFCGTNSNFDAIKGQLATFLTSWNAANPTRPADRVLGVVDEQISTGISGACAEGMAAINSPEAWIRAIYDRPGVPSMTGALIGMEIGHALGLVPLDRDHAFSPYHSPSQAADAGSNRGYNVRLRSFLADDRTMMTLSGTWNNTTTLVEQLDWAFLLCRFGGAIRTDCAQAPAVGTNLGIGAGPKFVLSGTTDGTAGGTTVVESYFTADAVLSEPGASDYRLVQRDLGPGGAVLAQTPIPVYSEASDHHEEGAGETGEALGVFAASVAFNTAADWIGFYHHDDLLYARGRTDPPQITSTQTVPAGDSNYTASDETDDAAPALSPDGAWVAWVVRNTFEPGLQRILVAPSGDSEAYVEVPGPLDDDHFDPSWRSDGAALAYSAGGDIYTVDVDTGEGSVTFGTPMPIYEDGGVDDLPSAEDPTWSPDGAEIAFEASFDIFKIAAAGGSPAVQLTSTNDAHSPSWSQTPGDNRIAYVRAEPVGLLGTTLASYVVPDEDGPAAPASHGTGAHFVVNSTDDVNDGTCDFTHCSLREAITAANATANPIDGRDAIEFNLSGTPPYTIAIGTTALPVISEAVLIDGTTQPDSGGAPLVVIDGSAVDPDPGAVLIISGGETEVRGLVINGTGARAIRLQTGDDNVIAGNYLGTDADGAAVSGGFTFGAIWIQSGSANNLIGGTTEADRNLIAGGIQIRDAGATGNVIAGNYIGTDVTGTVALGGVGVVLFNAADNTVGGDEDGAGNLISGLTSLAVVVSQAGATGNEIKGNIIGLDASGTLDLGNSLGVQISDAPNNRVGGTSPAERNVISGNTLDGVDINGAGATGNVVEGNYIGVDAGGTVAIPNGQYGLILNGAPNNTIGGTDAGAGNVIAGNARGVQITSAGNIVQGNTIGLGADGTTELGNGLNQSGIEVNGANNTIGGTALGAGNVISGHSQSGVSVSTGGDGAVVQGNLLGTDATGTLDRGNAQFGVVSIAANTLIGGTAAGAGNVISGNGAGVGFAGTSATGGVVEGNLIGTDITGTLPVGNPFRGVAIDGGAFGIRIGGDQPGAGNLIAYNGEGVTLFASAGTGNEIRGNQIHSNSSIGIDLADNGVTPNDAAPDADTGANGLQNFPVLTSATTDGSNVSVQGTLESTPNTEFTLDLFANSECDVPTGHGEGERYLGSAPVDTDGTGIEPLNVTIPDDTVADGELITATITDAGGSTSEFSACVEAVGIAPTLVVNANDDVDDGVCDTDHCSLREALLAGVSGATIEFEIPGSGPQTISVTSPLPWFSDITVDGTTQPGFSGAPLIEVDGSFLTDTVDFELGLGMGGGATVRGLSITGFPEAGVMMWFADGNVLESSYIGLRPDGTPAGNGTADNGPGIEIIDSSANTIGGTAAGAGNVISGNDEYGIWINPQSADNVIQGNYIGTDPTGEIEIGNGTYGIYIIGSSDNLIGGTDPAARNVISGNIAGIKLTDVDAPFEATDGTLIQGNYIGTNASGTAAVPNTVGISISASFNTVGGIEPGAGNVIAGNDQDGIAIFQFEFDEIGDNDVLGNRIGVGADDLPLGNGGDGISIDASRNAIGGTDPAGANVIANNANHGIVIDNFSGSDAHANPILGNSIFDNGALTAGLGIDLNDDGPTANDAGDSDQGPNRFQNTPQINSASADGSETTVSVEIFSGATSPYDIELFVNDDCDPSGFGEGETLVDQFTMTTSADGFVSDARLIGDDLTGLFLTATATSPSGDTSEFSNCLEVTAVGDPETLEVTTTDDVDDGACTVTHCSLREAIDRANDLPNGSGPDAITFAITGSGPHVIQPLAPLPVITDPVDILGSSEPSYEGTPVVQIDGADVGATGDGLVLEAGDSSVVAVAITGFPGSGISDISGFNRIADSYIGLDAEGGTPNGNGAAGVLLDNTTGSTIDSNQIRFNGGDGVDASDSGEGNVITANQIDGNGGLGIDLGPDGVTPNDAGDADTGPNALQNFPVIEVSADGTTISGSLNSDGNKDFDVEFFVVDDCDPSSHGEGAQFLGSESGSTLDGFAAFAFEPAEPITFDQFVTATVIDENGNTSEFSTCAARLALPVGVEVWTLDPTAPATSQQLLIADASQPSWGADGQIAFVRNADIYVAPVDDPESAIQVTFSESDSSPSLTARLAFVRFHPGEPSGQTDVHLLSGSGEVVVTATDESPEDLRLDVLYACPGSPNYPVLVGVEPSSTSGASATWMTNYDPSLACPDGTLTVIASDGFSRSVPEEAGTVESDPQAPVPTIYGPLDGTQMLQYAGMPLHGAGKDAEDGELTGASMQWFIDGNAVGSGGSVDRNPPAGGWPLGAHTIRLEVTDSDGTLVPTSVIVEVVADADNDGLPATVEALPCIGGGGDNDPFNAFGDGDADGYSNLDDQHTDGGPCVAATSYQAFATFGPNTLYAPSNGSEVTIQVTLPRRDIKQVTASSVRITGLNGVPFTLANKGWTIDKQGVATARFDRQALIAEIIDLGLVGQTVYITIEGSSAAGWSFVATDDFFAKAPN